MSKTKHRKWYDDEDFDYKRKQKDKLKDRRLQQKIKNKTKYDLLDIHDD